MRRTEVVHIILIIIPLNLPASCNADTAERSLQSQPQKRKDVDLYSLPIPCPPSKMGGPMITLWHERRGAMCVRGSSFAATTPLVADIVAFARSRGSGVNIVRNGDSRISTQSRPERSEG